MLSGNEEGIIKSIEPLLFKYSKEYTDVLPRLKKYMSSRKHLERVSFQATKTIAMQ